MLLHTDMLCYLYLIKYRFVLNRETFERKVLAYTTAFSVASRYEI
jgi:hypothetical protein